MNERELFTWALRGDAAAIQFCETVFMVSQVYDDLVDRDRPVPNDQIDAAFWACLVSIPENPFYRRHRDVLQPMLRVFMMDWLDSRALEQGDDHDKNVAFVLRDAVSALVIHCAALVGGDTWMREVSLTVRRAIFDETLDSYKAGRGDGA